MRDEKMSLERIPGLTYIDGSDIPLEGLPPMDAAARSAPPERPTAKGKPQGKNVTADRFRVLNAFVDCTAATLTRPEVLTWLILYRDVRDGSARTSASNIANRGGFSRRTAIRAISSLVDKGLLKVVYKGGIHKGASRYAVQPLVPELCHQPSVRAMSPA
jgi:hypothetical protein